MNKRKARPSVYQGEPFHKFPTVTQNTGGNYAYRRKYMGRKQAIFAIATANVGKTDQELAKLAGTSVKTLTNHLYGRDYPVDKNRVWAPDQIIDRE